MTKFLTLLAAIGFLAAPAFANEEMKGAAPAVKTEAAKEMKCAEGDKKCEEAKIAAEKAAEKAPAAGEAAKETPKH